MSLKAECHSKWNVTQNRMLFEMECQIKLNVTENQSHWKWNDTKLNVTQKLMSLKIECPSKWNFTQN